MKIRHLAIVPALFLVVACGGSSTPEPETPAGEAAGAAEEAKPAEAPAEEAKPAEGGEAAPAAEGDKPAEEKPAEEKK
jgi:hypothetical protein